MSKTNSDLLPCPGCGSEAQRSSSSRLDGLLEAYVECSSYCGFIVRKSEFHNRHNHTPQEMTDFGLQLREKVDASWNTRSADQCAHDKPLPDDLMRFIHEMQHKGPIPSEMCDRMAFITIIKGENGGYGYRRSGALSTEDIYKALERHRGPTQPHDLLKEARGALEETIELVEHYAPRGKTVPCYRETLAKLNAVLPQSDQQGETK